jgi:hypothetical protein
MRATLWPAKEDRLLVEGALLLARATTTTGQRTGAAEATCCLLLTRAPLVDMLETAMVT